MRKRQRKVDPRKLARFKQHRDLVEARAIGERVRGLRENRALMLRGETALAPHPAAALPRGVFLSFAEARAALAEEKREQGNTGGIATGLAIGLGAVAILGVGVIVCYLLFRKKDGENQPLAAPAVQPQIIREVIREVPARERRALTHYADPEAPDYDYEMPAARRISSESRARSFSLPALSNYRSEAVRVATATDRPCRATVRVVGPIGGHAVFAYTPNELNMPGQDTIPVGDTLIMAAGDVQEVRLPPRQAIYAKGSVPGVVVSVLTSEAPSDG